MSHKGTAVLEDDDELYKASVYIRRKLEAIEQNAAPCFDDRKEIDRAQRRQRRHQLKDLSVYTLVVPSSLAAACATGALHIEQQVLPIRTVNMNVEDAAKLSLLPTRVAIGGTLVDITHPEVLIEFKDAVKIFENEVIEEARVHIVDEKDVPPKLRGQAQSAPSSPHATAAASGTGVSGGGGLAEVLGENEEEEDAEDSRSPWNTRRANISAKAAHLRRPPPRPVTTHATGSLTSGSFGFAVGGGGRGRGSATGSSSTVGASGSGSVGVSSDLWGDAPPHATPAKGGVSLGHTGSAALCMSPMEATAAEILSSPLPNGARSGLTGVLTPGSIIKTRRQARSTSQHVGATSTAVVYAPPFRELSAAAMGSRAYGTRDDMYMESVTEAFVKAHAAGNQPTSTATQRASARRGGKHGYPYAPASGNTGAGEFGDAFEARWGDWLAEGRELPPWAEDAVRYPWLRWHQVDSYDNYIPNTFTPNLKAINENAYVNGYSVRQTHPSGAGKDGTHRPDDKQGHGANRDMLKLSGKDTTRRHPLPSDFLQVQPSPAPRSHRDDFVYDLPRSSRVPRGEGGSASERRANASAHSSASASARSGRYHHHSVTATPGSQSAGAPQQHAIPSPSSQKSGIRLSFKRGMDGSLVVSTTQHPVPSELASASSSGMPSLEPSSTRAGNSSAGSSSGNGYGNGSTGTAAGHKRPRQDTGASSTSTSTAAYTYDGSSSALLPGEAAPLLSLVPLQNRSCGAVGYSLCVPEERALLVVPPHCYLTRVHLKLRDGRREDVPLDVAGALFLRAHDDTGAGEEEEEDEDGSQSRGGSSSRGRTPTPEPAGITGVIRSIIGSLWNTTASGDGHSATRRAGGHR